MTQPLPTRRHFVQPHFPESLYYQSVEPETCPQCKQPMHSAKFSRREKVEALEKNAQKISGYVILHMRDGVEHRLPTPAVIALLAQVQRTIDWQKGVCPQWITTKYPRVGWFKQAVAVQSTDGGRVHEELLSLIRVDPPEGKAS